MGRIGVPFVLPHPIIRPKGGRLRIIIYCRISSDEQRQQSLADQEAYCRAFLAQYGILEPDVEIKVLIDDGITGERISRPGINEAGELLWSRWAHLLVSEDSGRIYRNEPAAFDFFGRTVDSGARIIAINDRIDTHSEDWPDRLHDAQREHGQSNHYLRRRILRTHLGLWEMGALVGGLRSGYRYRMDETAANSRAEDDDGPKFAEVDPKWIPTLVELFERVAADERTVACARFLTSRGLPRYGNSFTDAWNAHSVIALVRNPIYRGVEQYHATHSVKEHSTGRMIQRATDPEDIWTRPMPHLRIVSDHLWYSANQRIDQRTTCPHRARAHDNPLHRIPRDSRHPLADVFNCGLCTAKMHGIGKVGFRCSGADPNEMRADPCWNRATAKANIVYAAIADGLLRTARTLDAAIPESLNEVAKILEDTAQLRTPKEELLKQRNDTIAARNRWTDMVEKDETNDPPESIIKRIGTLDETILQLDAALQDLEECRKDLALPTTGNLIATLGSIADRLVMGDRTVRDELRLVVPSIKTFPFSQFGSNKVVLKARFSMNLLGLLPAAVRLALLRHGERLAAMLPVAFRPIPLEVELFERSIGPKHWSAVMEFEGQNLGLTEIGKRLGIEKHEVWVARTYGRKLRAAGLSDPFVELTEPPPSASRWRPNGRNGQKCG